MAEYGILTAISAGVRDLASVSARWISDLSSTEWVVITAVVLFAVWLWVRRE